MADTTTRRRNPLLPWWIGLIIIAAAVTYTGYQFAVLNCGPIGYLVQTIVLGIVPLVYLALMYMTFKGQANAENGR